MVHCCYSVSKMCSTLYDPMDTRPLCPLLSPRICSNSYPLSLWCFLNNSFLCCLLLLPSIFPSIHLFQWVSSLHQVAKILELQQQLFQCIQFLIFRSLMLSYVSFDLLLIPCSMFFVPVIVFFSFDWFFFIYNFWFLIKILTLPIVFLSSVSIFITNTLNSLYCKLFICFISCFSSIFSFCLMLSLCETMWNNYLGLDVVSLYVNVSVKSVCA